MSDFDPAALAMLRRLGGQDLVAKMVSIFLERAPGQLKAARDAGTSGDLQALEQVAHSLKSSSGQIGARRLFELTGEIESLAHSARAESVPGPIAQLEEAFLRVRPLLEKEMAG